MWTDVALNSSATLRSEQGASLSIEVRGVYLLNEGYNQTAISITCFEPDPASMKLVVETTFVGTLNSILKKLEMLRNGNVSSITQHFDYSRIEIDANHWCGHVISFQRDTEVGTIYGESVSGLKIRGMSAGFSINFSIGRDFESILSFRDELQSMSLELDYQLECIRAIRDLEERTMSESDLDE
jgi:hypothetical protein